MQPNSFLQSLKVIKRQGKILVPEHLQCEIRKEVLCEIKQFEPFTLFEQLKDQNYEGSLSLKGLYDYLIKNSILTSELELLCFFRFIKTKYTEKLMYSEFLQLLLPNKKQKLRQKVLVRQSFNTESGSSKPGSCKMQEHKEKLEIAQSDTTSKRNYKIKIASNIHFALCQVFDQEIRLFRLVEILRQKIFENKQVSTDLNLIQAFNSIDRDKKGSITRQDLLHFINKYLKGNKISIDDILNLWRRLNLDEDDTHLSYLQFLNVILPTEAKRAPENGSQVTNQYQNECQSVYKSMRSKTDSVLGDHTTPSKYRKNSNINTRESFNRIYQTSISTGNKGFTTQSTMAKKNLLSKNIQFLTQDTFMHNPNESIYQSEPQSRTKKRPSSTHVKQSKKQGQQQLRYSEVRKMQSQFQKLLGQKKPSLLDPEVSKYRQLREEKDKLFSRTSIQQENRSASKSKTRPKSKDQVNQQKYRNHSRNSTQSLYTNTIASNSPFRSIVSKSRANTSFISTPNKTASIAQLTQKSMMNSIEGKGDNFDQDSYNQYHKIRRGYVSPMKGKEEDYFVGMLKQLLNLENTVEEVKEELILYCNDFNPVQAFRIFVQNPEKGRRINIYNMIDAFNLMGVPLTNFESELMMKRFDSNRDGLLTFTDICDIFRPKNQVLQKDFDQRMPFEYQISQKLSEISQFYIQKLFGAIIQVENYVEHLKSELTSRPKFNLEQAFKVLNIEGYDKVSQEDLQQILRIHGLITFPRQVNPLFLRFDKDKDGLINFSDFKHEISPLKVKQHYHRLQ